MKKTSFFTRIHNTFKRIPENERRMTTATLFTIARIVLTPMIVLSMFYDHWALACCLFLIAGLTDLIDGLCARYLDQQTFLGALLDPIADKFLMLSCFLMLVFIDTSFFHLPMWFFVCVLSREMIQIIGGGWLYIYKGYRRIEPTILGKATTFIQILFILWICGCYCTQWVPDSTYCFMYVVLFLMGISSLQYILIAIQIIKNMRTFI